MGTLPEIVWGFRDELLRVDARSYPSKSMKSGIAIESLRGYKSILSQLLAAGSRICQRPLEAALASVDERMAGGIKRLCVHQSTSWDSWRRDTALSLRVMCAHVARKRQQHAKAIAQGYGLRSHPDFLIELYRVLDMAETLDAADTCEAPNTDETSRGIFVWWCVTSAFRLHVYMGACLVVPQHF